jgi:predicted nucleic acid-binding protein
VLDSNEYLFAFGLAKQPPSVTLLDLLVSNPASYAIRIPRMIIEEIRRNLPGDIFREVLALVQGLTHVDEDTMVPFELGDKYELAGLKPADALIVAYTEWIGAEALVTENRHFLSRRSDLPFRVLTAQQALKTL